MIHTTKGIVLRTVKYGETSVIASIFTELFGIQSYLINGVRTSGKTSKAHFFQPSSLLEMQVYHNELKNLQRIKELKWDILYKQVLSEVTKNSVALFMVELLQKCLRQPESNEALFEFCEDAFVHLDNASDEVTANFAVYFALQLAPFFGIRLLNNYSSACNTFNVQDGNFSEPGIPMAGKLAPAESGQLSELLKAIHPDELAAIRMNRHSRKEILMALESFYAWHISDFGSMKTLEILSTVLG